MGESEQLEKIYKIIERLCKGEDITEEDLKLVKEYIKLQDGFIEYLNKWGEDWKKFGIDFREISGDGWARENITELGQEKFLDLRAEIISRWRSNLNKIKSKINRIENRS